MEAYRLGTRRPSDLPFAASLIQPPGEYHEEHLQRCVQHPLARPIQKHVLDQESYGRGDANLLGDGDLWLGRVLDQDASVIVTIGSSHTTREEYIGRVTTGGFPMALGRSETARNRWFDNYVTLSLERDVTDLSKIRQKQALPRLLNRLVGQTAQMLNIASAGESAGLKSDTAENYTRLLEAIFLVHRLPAWGTSLRARAVARIYRC